MTVMGLIYTLPLDKTNPILEKIFKSKDMPFLKEDISKVEKRELELLEFDNRHLIWFISPDEIHGFIAVGAWLVNEQLEREMDEVIEVVYISTTLVSIAIAVVIFPIIYRAYKELLARKEKLIESYVDTIEALGNAIAKRDSDTDLHNFRVTWYSMKIAKAIGLDEKQMTSLIIGAFLYDIGKIAIPDVILLKPGRL